MDHAAGKAQSKLFYIGGSIGDFQSIYWLFLVLCLKKEFWENWPQKKPKNHHNNPFNNFSKDIQLVLRKHFKELYCWLYFLN